MCCVCRWNGATPRAVPSTNSWGGRRAGATTCTSTLRKWGGTTGSWRRPATTPSSATASVLTRWRRTSTPPTTPSSRTWWTRCTRAACPRRVACPPSSPPSQCSTSTRKRRLCSKTTRTWRCRAAAADRNTDSIKCVERKRFLSTCRRRPRPLQTLAVIDSD